MENEKEYESFYEETYKGIFFTIGWMNGYTCTFQFDDFDEFLKLTQIAKNGTEEPYMVESKVLDAVARIFRAQNGGVSKTDDNKAILHVIDCACTLHGRVLNTQDMITRCHKFIDVVSSMTKHGKLLDSIKNKVDIKRGGKYGTSKNK